MEPVVIAGVVAIAIQLAGTAASLCHQIWKFTRNQKDLPENLQVIVERLKLMESLYERIRMPTINEPSEYSEDELKSLAMLFNRIDEQYKVLKDLLQKYLPTGRDPTQERLKKGLQSLKKRQGNRQACRNIGERY
jgi:hypothetical protein